MPRTKLSEYSTTNSSNTDIEGINIDEGCAPSGINNAIRELMVHLKEFQTGASGDAFTFAGGVLISGTANTITGNVLMSGTNTITGSTTATFAAGAVGTPSIAAHGDTNTGIFFPAADTIAFAEGGAEAMRIDSSGNLGIGTTSPTSNRRLDAVINANASAGIRVVNSNAGTSTSSNTSYNNGTISHEFGILGTGYSTYGVLAASDAYIYASSDKNIAFGADGANAIIKFGTGAGVTERMRIDSSGNVGIGTSSPAYKLDVVSTSMRIASGTTGVGYVQYGNSSTATNNWHVGTEGDGTIRFYNGNFGSGTERARITSGGALLINKTSQTGTASAGFQMQLPNATGGHYGFLVRNSADNKNVIGCQNDGTLFSDFVYDTTTSDAANVNISTSQILRRSTSSIKYKTQVENIEENRSQAIFNLRPVWYRSLCKSDNANWSWYGLIAEEVAEIEPRLVHWGYSEEDYEVVETQEEVQKERTVTGEDGVDTVETYTETETKQSKQLKADAQLKPDGVQYDRLTVLLLDIVKRQNKRIETLEAQNAAFEARLAALEAK